VFLEIILPLSKCWQRLKEQINSQAGDEPHSLHSFLLIG
jgi:hypothetical protein